MRVWFVNRRTCITAPSGTLYSGSKIKLKKRVKGLWGYKWKMVEYSYFGAHPTFEDARKCLVAWAEEKRMFRRNEIRYRKLLNVFTTEMMKGGLK